MNDVVPNQQNLIIYNMTIKITQGVMNDIFHIYFAVIRYGDENFVLFLFVFLVTRVRVERTTSSLGRNCSIH